MRLSRKCPFLRLLSIGASGAYNGDIFRHLYSPCLNFLVCVEVRLR